MKDTYLLNENTGTLHIIGRCKCSKFEKVFPDNYKKFKTEDEVTIYAKEYKKKCKDCFKNR